MTSRVASKRRRSRPTLAGCATISRGVIEFIESQLLELGRLQVRNDKAAGLSSKLTLVEKEAEKEAKQLWLHVKVTSMNNIICCGSIVHIVCGHRRVTPGAPYQRRISVLLLRPHPLPCARRAACRKREVICSLELADGLWRRVSIRRRLG